MADIRGENPSEEHAWVQHFLPTSPYADMGEFHFSRPSPSVARSPIHKPSPQTLKQMEWHSKDDSNYPLEEVAQWAAEKGGPLRSAGETSPSQLYHSITDPYEIRVLELMPGSGDEPLRGSLHYCSIAFQVIGNVTKDRNARFLLSSEDLNQPVWYTALSYTWGPPVFDASIEIDGYARSITKTLESALKHFRHASDSIILWVDQICINQDDLEEKKQQIPLMSRIYTRALNTVIWLGESDSRMVGLMDFMNELVVRLQYSDEINCPEGLTDVQLPHGDSPRWRDLIDFFSRPWFYRLWIIQEVVLSSWLWVMCGEHVRPWRQVATPCSILRLSGVSGWLNTVAEGLKDSNVASTAASPTSGWEVCDQLIAQQEYFQTGSRQHSTLYMLLKKHRNSLSWDPRDKIYGMLAMCSTEELDRIRVDYSSDYPFSQLYHDVAKNKIRDMKKSMENDDGQIHVAESIHQVLSEVDALAMSADNSLPSWVPNWSAARRTRPLCGESGFASHIFRAAGESNHDYDVDTNDDKRLNLLASGFDKVTELTDIFHSPNLTYDKLPAGNEDLMSCFELCKSLQEYPNTEQIVFDAFWNTMVAGLDSTGRTAAPASYAEIFSLLLDASTGLTPSLAGQTYSARQKRPEGKGKLMPSHLGSRTAGTTFRSVRSAMQSAMRNRRLGKTEKGYIGLFPSLTAVDDVIHLVSGCPVPYVMRPTPDNQWRIIGECYVHGVMSGEVLKEEEFAWGNIAVV